MTNPNNLCPGTLFFKQDSIGSNCPIIYESAGGCENSLYGCCPGSIIPKNEDGSSCNMTGNMLISSSQYVDKRQTRKNEICNDLSKRVCEEKYGDYTIESFSCKLGAANQQYENPLELDYVNYHRPSERFGRELFEICKINM